LDLRFGVVYTFGSVINCIINTRYSVVKRLLIYANLIFHTDRSHRIGKIVLAG
jgi:hypothetical protein